MTDKSAWIAYLAGALLALAWKWLVWVRTGADLGKPVALSTREWFSLTLRSDKISWATTAGCVWVVGSIYIDRIVAIAALESIPVADSIAFVLGSLAEFTCPGIAKYINGRLGGGEA